MPARRRTVLLTAGVTLALTAGPLAAPALAHTPSPAAPPSASSAPVPTAPASAPVTRHSAPNGKALRAALDGVPGAHATAALVRIGGGDGVWRGSAGVRDLAGGGPADADARFRAGSVTKVVTAAVVLDLVADGRIALDRPVQHYLPGLLGPAFRPVTVRQLLNHTSGIRPGDSLGSTVEEEYAHRFDALSPTQVVASAVAKGPEFRPGSRQHYLNVNYTILGLLIEKVTGHAYATEARRRVLLPAGMQDTGFPGADPRIHGPHNRGYQAMPGPGGTTRLVDVTEWNQADRWAAGDMISTTADLERLVTALFQGRIVPEPQLREMFRVPAHIKSATYSAGLQRYEHEGRVYWFKSGARYGYSTGVAATRDLSRTVVYSVNDTNAKDESGNPVVQAVVQAALK
ncbi:serine hydrolase domain-containing protein [Streptomyces glaucescens]|uniref:Beta-lactamase n=1 Tax=Streptomyces glaucescens TaxID=1907 RepID=A0A089XC44_STRGA|nr:serine hydrolase domain-containing protein [Streptomyces glaucescens]AIS00814.1 beta-lactamase [Streptomyces glaucescens]